MKALPHPHIGARRVCALTALLFVFSLFGSPLLADTGDVDSVAASEAVHKEATDLFKKQEYEKAIQRVQDGLSAHPDDLRLLRLKGMLQRKTKDNEGAIGTYRALLKLTPDDDFVSNALNLLERETAAPGDVPTLEPKPSGPEDLIKAGQLNEALAAIGLILEETPEDMAALSLKGRVHRMRKQHAEAIAVYDSILKQQPDHEQAAAIQSLLLVETAKTAAPEDAFNALGRAVALSGHSPAIAMAYIDNSAAAKHPEKIIAVYDALKASETVIPDAALTRVAESYTSLKQYDQGTGLFEAILDRDPDSEGAAAGLVTTLALSGDTSVDADRVEALLEKHPENPDLHYVMAKSKAEAGDTMGALQSATRAMTHNPDHKDALKLRVGILKDLGCTSVALALAKTPGSGVAPKLTKKLESMMGAMRNQWRTADAEAHTGIRDASGLSLTPDLSAGPLAAVLGLTYYDVPASGDVATGSTSLATLISHIEYLRGHEYAFVSPSDIGAALRGAEALPERPIVLSFDHAYQSFATTVLPVLEQYEAAAVLGVATSWIENDSHASDAEMMSWADIKAANMHPLVTVASMADTLATHVPVNPQGRMGVATTTRIYNPATKSYETGKAYYSRIDDDLKAARAAMKEKTGTVLDMIVWPEGAYNPATIEIARALDYYLMFGLADGLSPQPGSDRVILRHQAKNLPTLAALSKVLYDRAHPRIEFADHSQGLFVDLDAIADADAEVTRNNINALVDRVKSAKPTKVYIKGYHDPDGVGNVASVYFPNSVLPVEQDILSHVSSMLRHAGFKVFIALPTLSVEFPRGEASDQIYAAEFRRGRTDRLTSWYTRLSPFSTQAASLMQTLYSDLAAHVEFDGILFESDAYLTDNEDFTREALEKFLFALGIRERNKHAMTDTQQREWADLKTRQINEFITALQESVSKYRYKTEFGRALLTPALLNPESQVWLSQNYAESIKAYDHVVISVNPETYAAENADEWMESLVSKADGQPQGLEKTVFRVESYSVESGTRIDSDESFRRMTTLSDAGARHVIYPENDVAQGE